MSGRRGFPERAVALGGRASSRAVTRGELRGGRWAHPAARGLLGAVVLLSALPAAQAANYRARYRRVEDPQLIKIRLTDLEVGAFAEAVDEETTFKNTGQDTTYERTFVAPALSIGAMGSVYHPNFVQFSLGGEGAYGWGHQQTTSSGLAESSSSRDEIDYYGRFRGSVEILPGKPLSSSLYGSYDRTYRDYDFFTRSTVETLEYGARLVYRQPTHYVGAAYGYTDEEVLDTALPTRTIQDLISLDAQHYRTSGNTTFNYTLNQYRLDNTDADYETLDHTVSLADGERLGDRRQASLQSNASYSHRDSDDEPSDQVSLRSELTVDHRPNLSSTYDANYDHYDTEELTTDSLYGTAELRHQLYESLESTFTLRASDLESETETEDGYTRKVGGGITEAYTKRIGSLHRIRVDNSFFVDQVSQSGIGQAVNERHTFPAPPGSEAFLLNLPEVNVGTIVVTDANDLRTYVRGIDYEIFPSGSRTEIRRISGGIIPQGGTVLVDYEAEPGATGRYTAMSDWFGIRLELWRNLWGLYGRVELQRNDAAEGLLVQELTRYTMGTDFTWEWLRTGAEYEIYDSTDYDYETARLFETFTFGLDAVSMLSFDFSQSRTDYVEADRQETNYRFLTRYRRAINRYLWTSADAGLDLRRGEGVDQDLAVFRPEIDCQVGRTRMELRYDYEYNLYLENEKRNRQRLTFELRREF